MHRQRQSVRRERPAKEEEEEEEEEGEIRDALCMRYGWTPENIPTHCTDGEPFTVEHALSCTRGGYVALRHNELRDLFADLLRETSTNVSVEPELQPPSGEVFQAASAVVSDGARLDIKASGFWASGHEVDFFDVRVFNPMTWHRLTSINPSTKHTQTTNGRRCLRTERG